MLCCLGVVGVRFDVVWVGTQMLCTSCHTFFQLISKAMDFIGPQNECESMLSELELKLSGDRIERLQGQAYDAGVVMEELQEDEVQGVAEKLGYTLPTGEEVREGRGGEGGREGGREGGKEGREGGREGGWRGGEERRGEEESGVSE